MTVFLFLLLSVLGFAQDEYRYSLEGTFSTKANLGSINPGVVNYSIYWNESDSAIQGIYRDNYFTQGIPRAITGSVGEDSRTFDVLFSDEVYGVESLQFVTNSTGPSTGGISMKITTKDAIGANQDNVTSFALMKTETDSTPTDIEECVVGFGALTGFCGLYQGTIHELSDTSNRCVLQGLGDVRLELGADTVFKLYFNYMPGNPNQYIHTIGAFLPSPVSNTINISRQECGELAGTSFIPENCKQINLNGIFFEQTPSVLFTGTYTISDFVSGDTCSYTMTLRR